MLGPLSRRVFLQSTGPLLLACAIFPTAIFSPTSTASSNGSNEPEYGRRLVECRECGGRVLVTCSACDGSGAWSPDSDTAGLYRSEWARSTGNCGWCNGTGEAECRTCAGRAYVLEKPSIGQRC